MRGALISSAKWGSFLYLVSLLPPLVSVRKRRGRHFRAPTVAERIGYSSGDRVLIINCDDLGCSQSANRAIEKALRDGIGTSASLMVPCPWARHAARACRDLDIGIHLTLTSEYSAYRWRSLTGGSSLHDRDGYLPATVHEVWSSAELEDVDRECRAQIDRALEWGVDVTHLDSHMDVMQVDRHFFEVYVRLGRDYRLPLRLRRPRLQWPFGAISRKTLDRAGILTTDAFISPEWGDPVRVELQNCARKLSRGVTEFMAHPVEDTTELHAYDTEFADVRADDARTLIDSEVAALLRSNNVRLTGYRPLREAMRAL